MLCAGESSFLPLEPDPGFEQHACRCQGLNATMCVIVEFFESKSPLRFSNISFRGYIGVILGYIMERKFRVICAHSAAKVQAPLHADAGWLQEPELSARVNQCCVLAKASSILCAAIILASICPTPVLLLDPFLCHAAEGLFAAAPG